MRLSRSVARLSFAALLVLGLASGGRSDDSSWVDLSSLDAWNPPKDGWSTIGSVGLDPKDARKLMVESGSGVIYNGPTGKGTNLISRESFGDVELHLEYLIPKGSNSGVKFQAVYEVQIYDSYKSTRKPSGRESGGVYPRSEEKPVYHQIDDGYAPLTNASKPAGEWQALDVTFLTPRVDASGKKTASARISATLNGTKVQDNLEVPTPTGSAWHDVPKTTGPILLQADHGPVAFRNVKVKRLPAKP